MKGGKGSHVKMRRIVGDGAHQTLIFPNHDEIDRGTLASIIRKALAYLSEGEMRPHFYTD